jgi:hypothetical protein
LKKLNAILIIPLMLLGAFLVPSVAHAATGVVSVNGGNLVTALKTDTTTSIPIQISGSDVFSGFDVQVVADPAILQGASVSLAGSIVPSPSILVECINGVLIAGTSCAPQDALGVVHLAVANIVGTKTATGTGTLFTINYNIVGQTTGTPISFNTGCVGTSVTNGDCVTIANGSPSAVSETDMGATFSNLIDFTMVPQFAALSTPSGVAISDMLNYASEGGFSDVITETVTATSGLTATLASGSVDLTSSTTGTDTLTVSGTTSGSVMVSGCGTFFFTTTCHSVTIPVTIAPAGFSVALSQASATIPRGSSDSSTKVNLAGVSGFTGAVTITSSSVAGITATAATTTLTPNGSGFSSASPTLTISVGPSVATGTYTLTVTGMSGAASHSASMSVVVPGQDFTIAAVPSVITIIRGGTLAADLNLVSLGNFAGSVSLSAVITNQGTDSCCSTTNIVPAFLPTSATLTAGGSQTLAFFAASVGGTAPPSTYTATGNYTATITATSGSVTHVVTITFNIEDFSLGPSFCTGNNLVFGTPDGLMYPVPTGTVCNSLTITNENIHLPRGAPGGQVLWVQTNALGGLITDGFDGIPSVAALNGQIPGIGIPIPQLHRNYCLLPTFWANGTQIPYPYLVANGPIIVPGEGIGSSRIGCGFDAAAWPNDVLGVPLLNALLGTNFPVYNNPDFFAVTAQAISGTLSGTYSFLLCGQAGVLQHCNTYGLKVINDPSVHQLVVKKSYSFAATHGLVTFKLGVQNNDVNPIFVQVTAIGIGSAGDTFSATTGVVSIGPGASANNLQLSTQLTHAEIGETFTFTVSISVGTDATNLTGTSTLLSISRTFVLTA